MKYTFKSMGMLGEIYRDDGEEAGIRECEFYLATDVAELVLAIQPILESLRAEGFRVGSAAVDKLEAALKKF